MWSGLVLISRALDQSSKVQSGRLYSVLSVKAQKEYGGDGKKDTPVPMPNTEVKLLNAESSWWETACEGRQSPCSFLIFRLSSVGRAPDC